MAIDLTHLIKGYAGRWVGLKDDEQTVVASGSTVKEVMEQAKDKGYEKPILFRVPTQVMPYVGPDWAA
jgi:hypothetical protein